jgi:RHS repeat-associated protein
MKPGGPGTTTSGNTPQWVGSLMANGVGSTGMAFRRNRFYDGATGQFNQQDPIGLAGGANSYGFAGGDPVNYRDPFGLCPIEKDGVPCTVTMGLQGAVAGSVAGAVYGAVGGTLVAPGIGTVAGAGGGAVVLGGAGLLSGSVVGAARDISSIVQMSRLGDWLRELDKKTEGLTKGIIVGGMLAPGATTTGVGGDRLPPAAGGEQPATDDKKNPPKQPPEP